MTVWRWLILTMVVGTLTGVALGGTAARPPDPSRGVVRIQLSLRILGYDPGPIDGLSGQRTIAALAAYAKDRRLVLNQATAELVVTLVAVEALEALRQADQTDVPLRGPRVLPLHHR